MGAASIEGEAALDGIYVIRTSVLPVLRSAVSRVIESVRSARPPLTPLGSAERLGAEAVVQASKDLAEVEQGEDPRDPGGGPGFPHTAS